MTDTTTTDVPATTAPTGRRRSPKATPGQVMELARTLPLTRDVLRRACDDATPGQLGFLAGLFKMENASRAESKRARLLRQAGFPQSKTLDGYDRGHGLVPRRPGDANSSPASSSWTGPRTSCSTATSDAARRTWPSRSGNWPAGA